MEKFNHVLIVDDVLENIQLVGSMLQRRGYRISLAEHGEQAFSLIEQDPPHLILLDISMPEMDGFDVCTRLKNDPKTRDIPIIFLTAFSDKGRIIQGFEVGAVDYVTKPFHSAELFSRIRTHLDLRFTKELVMQRNQQLQELNDKIQQALQDKDELLGIVAHDLKSPLSAIRSIAEALTNDTSLTNEETSALNRSVLETSTRMFSLVEDLLSTNALERGGITFRMMPVDIGEILLEILHQYTKSAHDKQLTVHFHPTSRIFAYTDEKAVIHILDNLFSNSIKYSPHEKSVYVSIEERPASAAMPLGSVRVAIKDEGQGMTEEDMSKLFRKFTRLSAQPTAGEHSTGLGLSIVKKLADGINARVWCESVYGQGATFFLDLPRLSESQRAEFGL
ncbi:MAG: hybrid sensor histidine kinase/response regulator [Candidatus Kapaibacterium sp.]|nr:MAG: hybrid sensor histidine kinase/response regulator [Candidatus Kapabacteria bacterium]